MIYIKCVSVLVPVYIIPGDSSHELMAVLGDRTTTTKIKLLIDNSTFCAESIFLQRFYYDFFF